MDVFLLLLLMMPFWCPMLYFFILIAKQVHSVLGEVGISHLPVASALECSGVFLMGSEGS